MIPIDHYLAKCFGERQMVYTRYADDIHISSKYDFKYRDEIALINKVIKGFNGPYVIKPEKTHYGSSAGKNYLLGLLLNKDNNITIGHRQKKMLKAMINNYICDFKNGIQWDLGDVQEMVGKLSYYKMVEPENIKHIIITYNKKYHVNLGKILKADIGGRHGGE